MTQNVRLAKGDDGGVAGSGGGTAHGDNPNQRPVVRFAPSPNGLLHLGHAFSALFTAAVADTLGARLLLRIEDIDTGRCRPEFAERIFEDLHWLGLTWEEPVRWQSDHMADYHSALATLEAKGLLYRARASRRQIKAAVAAIEAAGQVWTRDPDGAPHYPRRALGVIDEGGDPSDPSALRLDMERALAGVPDLTFCEIGPEAGLEVGLEIGPHPAQPAAMPHLWGDAVLARKDIATSYHISVVVDDALQGVTHVTRGADLAPATHLHRLLQHHLGLPCPIYCHHPLLLDHEGAKLAKSLRSQPLCELVAAGKTKADIRDACGIDRLAPYFAGLT